MCAGKDLRGIGSAQNTFSEASGLSAFLRNVRQHAPFMDKKSTLFLHLKKFVPAGTTHAMLSGQCESPHAGTVLDNLDGFVTLYQEVQYVAPPSRLWN